MNSRRSWIGATTPLKLRPRSSVETPPNNFVIDTGSLEDGIEERKENFHYHSLVGQLNYLTASTRPEIQYATHQ